MAELKRRAVLDSERWAIEIMGRNGLHASAICEKLKLMGRGSFTPGQIYRVLRSEEISTLDYRNGCNEEAGGVFVRALWNNGKGGTRVAEAKAQLPKKPRRARGKRTKKRRK